MTKQKYLLFIQHREADVTCNYKKGTRIFPSYGTFFSSLTDKQDKIARYAHVITRD